ncbi:MAG: formylglycine-generating enzyme family protein, partial [Sphingobacteriales bacterium]
MKKTYGVLMALLLGSAVTAQMGPRKPNPQLASQPTQGQLRELFAGPGGDHKTWLDSMNNWRTRLRDTLAFNTKQYERPELSWTKNIYSYAQVMSHDRYLYDPKKGEYTVDRFIDDVTKRYGGLDAVLIWPTYPNIGIDDRNQLDYLAAMPGGHEGVKKMVDAFHKKNVRVFFPIMIWDHGTKPLDASMAIALTKAMIEVGADGLNGDTMPGVTEDYKTVYDSLHYALALQPELSLQNLKMAEWNTMSWGYFWEYAPKPGVSIYKWLEPRHQVQITNRWATDKTDDLQYAFFNGIGYNAWENIWGVWNQVTDRHAEMIRRIRTIYQQFPDVWSSTGWVPHLPLLQQDVYASVFPGAKETVYTFVNRDTAHDKKGELLKLPFSANAEYYDAWNGKQLKPRREGNDVFIDLAIESRGFGAVVVITKGGATNQFNSFLKTMATLSAKPLSSYSAQWKEIPQLQFPLKPTAKAGARPDGMIDIPATKSYEFESIGVMIEGKELPTALGIQHPWEKHAARSQKHVMEIPSFYIDQYPVTNEQFKRFLAATKYHPQDDYNFLKYWSNGTYPEGTAKLPVTWVSIEDARAYAAWAGKRLPHEWEWQYAAQGTDGRLYPWGAADSTRRPPVDSNRVIRLPSAVDAFPQGASIFGVMDLTGNIWQWTDEYQDEHTRAAVLKGGSYYQAKTSRWYFPQAYELNKYGKY